MDKTRWNRLSALLDELFDLEADARDERLSVIARGDAALASELRHLLALEEHTGLLDGDVANAAATVMSQLAAAAPDAGATASNKGRRIGHYHLIERLGTGGMGEVWRAERVDDFEQAVAVKLIRPLLDSPALRERFSRERRILARLDHPGIARLLDGGVADDGTPWYAMEFVPGCDIVRFANERKLGTRERVELLLQVCDATAHAQSQLIVHRDLKPSNILVDAQGRARVLDFGIARLLDDSGAEALTSTGVRVFSPAYAAPEQIRGEVVGTAADVFALGAVLYELLVGTPPHPARSSAPERLLARLADETAPRPSHALRHRSHSAADSRTTTARDISADLDTLVATALQPDPTRRYAGAAQLADDLRRWLDGRPIAAQPDTASYRMRKFVSRHRFAVGSASAVLLALIGGLGLALWQAKVANDHAHRADAEAQRAEHQAEQVRAQMARTRKVKEFMVSVFQSADPMRRSDQAPQTIDEAFDAALERARTELGSDPVLQADVLDDFGEIRANQGRFEEARTLFEQALAVAEKEYGPHHPIAAESLVNLSVLDYLEGKTQNAVHHIERAVAILEQDDGGDPLALASALTNLTAVQQIQGNAAAMLATNERALQLYRTHAPGDPRMIPALSNAALIALNAGEHDKAKALLDETVALIEREHGPDSPTLWSALTSLAELAYARGDTAEQRALTERALTLVRGNFGGNHPWIASSLGELGLILVNAGEPAQGEAMLREAIAMHEHFNSSNAIAPLRYLSIAQGARDDRSGALDTLTRAYALCEQTGETASQLCLVVRANRALLLARSGQGELALHEADAAIQLLSSTPGIYSERAQAMEARAAALSELGRHAEALAEQEAAIDLLNSHYGPGHPETRRVQEARHALMRKTEAAH
ncbi:serine/threonine-protein kinase [Xanthomonadaceae bacterium JHOS43]|nr:serine/threonine-protein kinase [Xanthomonadaceae bacterium JHOS43]